MACLEMRKGSKWWYGRWQSSGKLYVRNLDVVIEGKRPASVNTTGDRRFEASRAKALAKLEETIQQAKSRRAEELVQTLHEIRTGSRVGSIAVEQLYDRWVGIPRRRRRIADTYKQWAETVFKRFETFLGAQHPDVKELGQVSHAVAIAFMAAEAGRGVSGRTHNATLGLLKGAFQHLRREGGYVDNPFEGIVTADEETIHRRPFSPEELRAIVDASQNDELCRSLIITGLCTAMRRGDVCQLRWSAVDLAKRAISVKTAKTGEPVWIPIFPMLYDELSRLPHEAEYCFPEAARLYKAKPDELNRRLNTVFRAAGFAELDADGEVKASAPNILPPEVLATAREALEKADPKAFTRKVRGNLLRVFDLYAAGMAYNQIVSELGMSKGSISLYMKRVEKLVGFPVVRTAKVATQEPGEAQKFLHEERTGGARRVNVHGFHALRSTWVTLALTAGVPVELVRTVTGHTLTETVIAHYFRPNQEQMRVALLAAMPSLLTNGAPSRDDEMRDILTKTSAELWAQDSKRLLELLDDTREGVAGLKAPVAQSAL
jgi:integrase